MTLNAIISAGALLAVAAFAGIVSAAEPVTKGSTLGDLQAAYDGESNAQARYTAFAAKADDDGYGQVASLFRAAARAEQIHAQNHADVIKRLGATAEAKMQTPVVRSTAENLKAAIDGESYERDTMYPAFIEQARKEGNRDAVRTFNLARTAEMEHAKLYTEALKNLDSWKGGKRAFYVCTVCGETLVALPSGKCPSCFSPKEKFVSID
jgi:rubrerythrin